ncbi:unnamed protein product [Oikopleura dioica]|uniref:Uncharacterized protein n=1 Tax=Oikopleura dioica TaxID=34765 RepID=E4WV05_OIKDI|nr:unnamed protein product [Oikopleura dioica]
MESKSRKRTALKNLGIFSLGIILRLAALSFNLQDRPELNSPSQSYSQISEERYSANQSFIAKSLKYFLQTDLSWVFFLSFVDFVTSYTLSYGAGNYSRKNNDDNATL